MSWDNKYGTHKLFNTGQISMLNSDGSTIKLPHLRPRFLSHGTVECHDIDVAWKFYTQFLGLEVRQTSSRSLMLRLNSTTTIACVETRGETSAGIYSHFGLDFDGRDDVDAAYRIACPSQSAQPIISASSATRPSPSPLLAKGHNCIHYRFCGSAMHCCFG